MTRIEKLEVAVRAGLGLRKALAESVPGGPMFEVRREVVEKYDAVIDGLKPKPTKEKK